MSNIYHGHVTETLSSTSNCFSTCLAALLQQFLPSLVSHFAYHTSSYSGFTVSCPVSNTWLTFHPLAFYFWMLGSARLGPFHIKSLYFTTTNQFPNFTWIHQFNFSNFLTSFFSGLKHISRFIVYLELFMYANNNALKICINLTKKLRKFFFF